MSIFNELMFLIGRAKSKLRDYSGKEQEKAQRVEILEGRKQAIEADQLLILLSLIN